MNSLVKFYVDLMLLRTRPQDCPPSRALQSFLVSNYLIVSIIASIPAWGILTATVRSILDIVILFVFINLLLRNRKERIHQTLNALFGAGAIFAAISAILAFFVLKKVDDELVASSPSGILLFALLFWLVLVYGHILKNALDSNFGNAMVVAFLYIISSTFLVLLVTTALGFS